jgi:hypothetical protein
VTYHTGRYPLIQESRPFFKEKNEENVMEEKLSRIELAERKVTELQIALDEIQGLLHTAQEAQEAARRMMPLLMMVGGGLAAAGAVWYLLRRRDAG